MNKEEIQKMKADMLDHIRKTPFDELYEELVDAGSKTYKKTPNVSTEDDDKPFDFSTHKGWVSNINKDGSYDVELVDMIDGSRDTITITDEEVYESPDIQIGSVCMIIKIPSLGKSSIKFQKKGKPMNAEDFEEIAYKAKQVATKLSKDSKDE